MLTGKEDLLRSLIEAFLMEKGTHEFYEKAALKAVNAEAKKTFRALSDWEERHMEFIQSLYLAVQEDRDVESFENFKNKTESPVSEAGIPVEELVSKFEEHSFTDDKGALVIALEIEGKAYNLYRGMSEKATDTNARVVFEEMMAQELTHIDYLKKMRTSLAETA